MAKKKNRSVTPAVLSMVILTVAAVFLWLCLTGYTTLALLCMAAAGVIGFYTFVPRIFKKSRTVIRLFTCLLILILIVFGITEAIIIRASFGQPEAFSEYLVVLGAKVSPNGRPSLALRNRIDAAYDYLTAHPDAIAVLSGGQGPDEPMTEARCIFQELTAMGIDPERLWLEEESTSTWENLKFTLAVIEEKTGSRPTKIALLSNEFHLYRAGLFAKEFGLETVGVPAKTTLFFLKINYFIREAAAIWHYLLIGGNHYA